MPSADLSTRHQVRQSLFCYLKIVIDRLPAWSDFWKQQTECLVPITPETLRLSLSDMEIYDNRLLRLGRCFKQSRKWYETFGENFGEIFGEAENTMETDDTYLARFFGSLIDGSYVSVTIKAFISRMDRFYKTKVREPLESIEDAIGSGVSPSHLPFILASRDVLLEAEKEAETLLKGLKEVSQLWDSFSRGDADIPTEFDLISSIPGPFIPCELVAAWSDAVGMVLGSTEAGTH